MTEPATGQAHPTQGCRCIITPAILRDLRRRHMVSIEAVAEVSGYSHEHLAALERATSGTCISMDELRAYEQAMGMTAEAALLASMHELLGSLSAAHEMLTRLYRTRISAARQVPTSPPRSHRSPDSA